MRSHHKTIRGLSLSMGITMKRVRHVLAQGVAGTGFVTDWLEAIRAVSGVSHGERRQRHRRETALLQGRECCMAGGAGMKARESRRPADVLRRLGGWVGGSIGQAEALAGFNVQCRAERLALWHQFRHLYAGEPQVLVDAVMDHCAALTLKRIKKGTLSLIQNQRSPVVTTIHHRLIVRCHHDHRR